MAVVFHVFHELVFLLVEGLDHGIGGAVEGEGSDLEFFAERFIERRRCFAPDAIYVHLGDTVRGDLPVGFPISATKF